MNHNELRSRAAAWLRSRMRCDPVLTHVASAGEIPDAIGWNRDGSILVECKSSRSDFLKDRLKYMTLKHKELGYFCNPDRVSKEDASEFEEINKASMGDYRYFMVAENVNVTVADVKDHHGLIRVVGEKVRIEQTASLRSEKLINYNAEIRYLRFALIHVRDNLQKLGCSVDLPRLTMFFGEKGVEFPK